MSICNIHKYYESEIQLLVIATTCLREKHLEKNQMHTYINITLFTLDEIMSVTDNSSNHAALHK